MGTPVRQSQQWVLKNSYIQEVLSEARAASGPLPLLTTIGQVRRLSTEAASRLYPVRVKGVVTAVFETGSNLVIQDADQGVFVSVPIGNMRGHLEIGDSCEVSGATRAAAWAPMIDAKQVVRLGLGQLPEPLHPTWDQILNGSLDSQYVEVQGLVTAVQPSGVSLLTRMGPIQIDGLGAKSLEDWRQFEDALVRVRGCVLAVYDRVTAWPSAANSASSIPESPSTNSHRPIRSACPRSGWRRCAHLTRRRTPFSGSRSSAKSFTPMPASTA